MKWYEVVLKIVTSDIFCTIIGGVFVFVISQWLLELVIKPRVEYKKIINKILYSLNYYADVISNPMIIHRDNYVEEFRIFSNSKHAQASEEFRKLGCEIVTFAFKKKRNEDISKELIYLSNAMWYFEDLPPDKENRPTVCLEKLQHYLSNKKTSLKGSVLMLYLLNLWKPKNKFGKIINAVVRVIALIIFFAFLILPFISFEEEINGVMKWVWIGCAVCNIDSLVNYKKYHQQKLITPLFTIFSILTLTYLYNYWALLSLAIIVCVGIVIGLLEFIVSVAVYRTIRFSEKAIEKELPSKAIQGIVLGGLYACAVILFILGHHISENMIFTFGVGSAIMLSVSVLICIGNGISSKKSIFSVVSFIVDTLSLLALIIYLIYKIPNENNLQEVVLTILSSVIGGALTLAGVAWTIRKGDKDRQADLSRREQERKEDLERMEKERKEDLERLERVRREDITRVENERREEEKKKAKPIFAFNMVYRELDTVEGKRICYDENPMNFKCEVLALLENSEHSSFTITRVYHDNKWWNIIANNVILPSKCVYFDFNFTEDVNNLFMEIKDGLDNAYYYEIKVLCLGLLARKQPNLSDNMLHTIRELKEITLEEINKRITKVNP